MSYIYLTLGRKMCLGPKHISCFKHVGKSVFKLFIYLFCVCGLQVVCTCVEECIHQSGGLKQMSSILLQHFLL